MLYLYETRFLGVAATQASGGTCEAGNKGDGVESAFEVCEVVQYPTMTTSR